MVLPKRIIDSWKAWNVLAKQLENKKLLQIEVAYLRFHHDFAEGPNNGENVIEYYGQIPEINKLPSFRRGQGISLVQNQKLISFVAQPDKLRVRNWKIWQAEYADKAILSAQHNIVKLT